MTDETKPEGPFRFTVGDIVDYHSTIGREVTAPSMVVSFSNYQNGKPVYWLAGKPGYVAEAALSPSNLPRTPEVEASIWRGRVPILLDALEGITSVATSVKAENTPEFMEYLDEMIKKARLVWSQIKEECK